MGDVVLRRAISTFEVKAIDDEARIVRGIASTPETDRTGDVLDPLKAKYTLPIPFLYQHRGGEPLGTVTAAQVTKQSIEIVASVAKLGIARIEEAWSLIKAGLVRGLSVGFRPIEDPELVETNGVIGFKFGAWEWVELSAVTIPANRSATILTVKSLREFDAPYLAATGDLDPKVHARGDTRTSAIRVIESRGETMKPYADQVRDWENTRRTKEDRRDAILAKFNGDGTLPDAAANEELDTLDGEIAEINKHIARLKAREAEQASTAKPVIAVSDPVTASKARDTQVPTIEIKTNLPPGMEFVRAAICKLRSFLDQGSTTPVQYAKALYPDCPRVVQYLERAAVPAANTINAANLGALVPPPTNLGNEFLAFVGPATILGKFGTGNVPSLYVVPFNVRIPAQLTGGTGYWVGQGAAKPLTGITVGASTLLWTKVAAISVLTDELARFSSPSAELMLRNALRDALVARLDTDFVDPAKAAVAAVSPASVTNGVTPLVSAGSSADAIREDLATLINAYVANNQDVSNLVLIMPQTLAVQIGLMRNPLGQREFDGLTATGGTLEGIPVITSQYAVHGAAKNMVIAVNAKRILLADDGSVTVDASREASIEMSDAPTANSITGVAPATSMISMFQTNSIALRAERYVNWQKANATACVWLDNVTWGSPSGS